MILSALLTSVGINLGLCFLFFALYSILRKQPGNAGVYAPRLVADGKAQHIWDFNLERLLPSAGWMRMAWRPSEDDLLSNSGLDAVVFMRIFIFSLKVFTFAAVIGIFVLLPVNYMGNQLSLDFTGVQNKTLESFTISNVDNGSNRLWIHFCAVYAFTVFVCCLLYFEHAYISSKRLAYFYSSKPQPQEFTVLVRSIPITSGRSVSDSVDSFFTQYYPSTYLSHCVIRRTSKLKYLINDADKLYGKIVRLRSSNQSEQRFKRAGFMGLFGRRIDLLDQSEKKLEHMEDNVRTERSSVVVKQVRAAFVSFKTRLGAATALHIRQGLNPTEWITERAPHPKDVYWPFFSASFIKRWICSIIVIVAVIVLTILFLIPVVLVQGLTHLDQLEVYFPFLKSILRFSFVSHIVTGYLPSLILQLFLYFMPPIMVMFSSIQGYIALSEIEKSACIKVLWFTIWNIFFANVLSGSALYRVDVLLEPKKIPNLLAVAVPGQATFFIAYVVTSGWTSTALELVQFMPLFYTFIKRRFGGDSQEELKVPSIPYHREIPRILFFGLLGVTYFFLAPLILPFLLVFYCLGYIIYRNQGSRRVLMPRDSIIPSIAQEVQPVLDKMSSKFFSSDTYMRMNLLNVYAPKFETGGKFWPIVHDSMIFSLVLMHIIAIGIFGLKDLPLASSLTIPLPILTLIFNSYCQRRFMPTFKGYSAESLIKKDRNDRNDPTILSFYEELATAYRDPALVPVRYSTNDESMNSPLLDAPEA